jgi:hypothetical protein
MNVGFLVQSVRTAKPPAAPEHLAEALVTGLSSLRHVATLYL